MAKFHARPSLQYRYEHYDPQSGLRNARDSRDGVRIGE